MTAKTRRYLSGDDIIALDDQKTEDVHVPQWDTYVTLRSMTGAERDRYEGALISYTIDSQGRPQAGKLELDNLRARLVSLVAINHETGQRLFSEQQVAALGKKNGTPLDLLFQAALTLSNLTPPAIEAAKAALGKDQNDAPGSDSPESLE